MTIRQLRNHIPVGSPARREPVKGNESPLRVSLGFEPAWFHQRCRVNLGERWHTDPSYRHEALVEMKGTLCRAFPQATCWDPDDDRDLWTISGCYGAFPVAWIMGCELAYAPDRWPTIVSRPRYTRAELEGLSPDDFLHNSRVQTLLTQMDTIEAVGKPIHGYLNWQGVLNNAFNICGQEIFVDLYQRPGLARHVFSLICEVMIGVAQQIQARQRASGFYVNQMSVSNCVMNMISPETYATFLGQHDRRIAQSFESFGIHTCNWDVSPYLEVLRALPKVGYLDMGITSDMARAKATFPQARHAVLYSPGKLHDASLEAIEADMVRVYRELAPCDVIMADIQATTPDTRVNALLRICADLTTHDKR